MLIQSGSVRPFNPDLDLIGRMWAAMLLLDGTRRRLVGDIHNIIHMLAHRDEQIEKPDGRAC